MSARPSDDHARAVVQLRMAIEATRTVALREAAVSRWYEEQARQTPRQTAACGQCRACASKSKPKEDESSSSSSEDEGK